MGLTKEAQIVKELVDVFIPHVLQDEDIQEFINENEINEEDTKHIVVWLASAATGFALAAKRNNDFSELLQIVELNCREIEKELSNRYENIHEILVTVLKENMDDWIKLVDQQLQQVKPNSENIEIPTPSSDVSKIVWFLEAALASIVVREDDAIEFIEKYNTVDKNWLIHLICLFSLYNFADKLANERSELQSGGLINKENVDEIVDFIGKHFVEACKQIEPKVNDVEQYKKDINELIQDHLNEFIKKLNKLIAKLNNQ